MENEKNLKDFMDMMGLSEEDFIEDESFEKEMGSPDREIAYGPFKK